MKWLLGPYDESVLEAVDFYAREDFEPELAMHAMAVAFRGLVKAPDEEAGAKGGPNCSSTSPRSALEKR